MGTVTLGADCTANGTLSILTSQNLAIGAHTLTLNNNTISATSTGTLVGGATSNLVFGGVGGTTLPSITLNNLTINRSSSTVTLGGATSVAGALTLSNGALSNGANLTLGNGATISRDIGSLSAVPTFGASVNVSYTGSTLVTTGNELPTSMSVLNNLSIGKSGGLTLNASASVNGTLTLSSGKVTTTPTNLLTVTNPASAAISGGSSSSYINGPLARALPGALATGATFLFPVGKGSFSPFEMVNPTTTVSATIRAEEFDANAGGTVGTGLGALNTNRYWMGTITSGSFTNTTVKLTDSSVTLNASSRIGKSATAGGTYNSIGGTVSGSTITSDSITSFSSFVIGSASAP